MATCASLLIELSVIQAEALSINSSWRATLSAVKTAADANDAAGANAGLRELTSSLTKIKNLYEMVDGFGAITDEAEKLNCTDAIAKANQVSSLIRQTELSLNSAINTAKTYVAQVQQAVAKSNAASTTTNNAGTGTPGTAPSSSAKPAPLIDDDGEPLVEFTGPPDISDIGVPVFDEDGNIEGGIIDEPLDIDDPGDLGNFDPADIDVDVELPDFDEEAPYAEGSSQGLSNSTFIAESTATAQDNANFEAFEDWRVRLTLANDAQYLYRAQEPGILAPLATTDGVVFPYTPIIAVNYAANYEPTTITHSNYKIFQYSSSSVDSISITCDFTAQDTYEANYMLAVIHFFRSMTKMFYGQDEFPRNGTPPPLCFLFGLGGFQFEAHPLAITGFSYNLPNDVDYIRTTTTITSTARYGSLQVSGNGRLPREVLPGGIAAPAQFDNDGEGFTPSYVPTKIQLAISCIPVMSRNAISNRFSLRDYATGKLLQGTKNPGGGIW